MMYAVNVYFLVIISVLVYIYIIFVRKLLQKQQLLHTVFDDLFKHVYKIDLRYRVSKT